MQLMDCKLQITWTSHTFGLQHRASIFARQLCYGIFFSLEHLRYHLATLHTQLPTRFRHPQHPRPLLCKLSSRLQLYYRLAWSLIKELHSIWRRSHSRVLPTSREHSQHDPVLCRHQWPHETCFFASLCSLCKWFCHLYSQLIRTGVYTHSSAHSRILSHTGLLCVSFETAAMAFTRCHIRTFSCPSRTFHINIKKLDSIRQTSSSSHWGVSIYYLDILISRNEVFSPIIETGWLRPTLLHTRRMYQIKTVAPLK